MIEKMNEYGKRNIPFLFLLDFELKQPIILPLGAAAKQHIFFNIQGKKNFLPITNLPEYVVFNKFPIDYIKYKKAFDLVQRHLRLGDSFLTNLTFPTAIDTNLSLRQIFEYSQAPYRLLFKDQFTVFSPESFIQIKDGQIASFPMKGTINANLINAKQQILEDTKERAEHHTIVDLIRNDLSQVAKKVRVDRFRYIDRIHNWGKDLLQVSSKIVGQLPTDYTAYLGDIFRQLLPAGSICGAPKPKTLEIIKAAENYERGYYTGVFGYYENGSVESAVMIRFIERQANQLYYKSGGGITARSESQKEYQEMIDKVYALERMKKEMDCIKNQEKAWKLFGN
ncbi:MAG: aminodeoxychorismate synthase component I [Bacteroidota bacterium]